MAALSVGTSPAFRALPLYSLRQFKFYTMLFPKPQNIHNGLRVFAVLQRPVGMLITEHSLYSPSLVVLQGVLAVVLRYTVQAAGQWHSAVYTGRCHWPLIRSTVQLYNIHSSSAEDGMSSRRGKQLTAVVPQWR